MKLSTAASAGLFLLFAGCSAPDAGPPAQPALVGEWRAVLESPGGELPFLLRIEAEDSDVPDDGLKAVAVTAGEEVPFSDVQQEGSRVVLRFAWYDSEISARFEDGALVGEWRKTVPGGDSRLPFKASRNAAVRFPPAESADGSRAEGAVAIPTVDGAWTVEFRDEDGEEAALGTFRQRGDTVTGTFLTPTGDYRFLEGSYEEGLLRLSTFDGAHAFLFHARAQGNGSLHGDFWSRDSYHATWIARPATGDEGTLPDPWQQVELTNDDGRLSFRFPDLEGQAVSLQDPRFANKVVLVNVFGTWCPNCNDEAPLLAQWHRRYRDQGLEIVGLAYEFSGDPTRDSEMIGRFAERYGIEYPLLLAGVSDKSKASATLPDLSAVLSYPTSIFVGRDGKVRRIHSGFAGPGTGKHYEQLVHEFETLIEELLAGPA